MGVQCALDPCDSVAVALPDVFVCPPDHRCVIVDTTADPRLGICNAAIGRWGDPCGSFDPREAFDQCGRGTFCARAEGLDACGAASNLEKISGEDYPVGVCLPANAEGQPCDSNMSDRDEIDLLTGLPREVGCRPCERGTFCVSADAVGVDTGGRVCARACDDGGGVADQSVCACGTSACEQRTLDPADFPDGLPPTGFFCGPCTRSGVECDGIVPCCDESGSCLIGVPLPGFLETDATTSVCCRGDNSFCDPTAPFEQCCPGSTCSSGQCVSCGRVGADATTTECCPGLQAITTPDGTICERCGAMPGDLYRCSPNGVVVEDSMGGFDVVPVPRSDDAVPFRILSSRSTRGGDLISAARDAQLAHINLTSKHRAYLFPSPLSSGTVSPETALHLPFTDSPPSPVTASLPTSDLSSIRVYDTGACSHVITWPDILTIYVTQLLGLLGQTEDLRDVVHLGTTIHPRLRSTPRYPGTAPLGTEDASDQVTLMTEITAHADVIIDCGFTMTISPTLTIDPGPAVRVPRATAERDDELASVRCEPNATGYTCFIPENPDGTGPIIAVSYVADPGDFDMFVTAHRVGCNIRLEDDPPQSWWLCVLPNRGATLLSSSLVVLPRPLDFVPGAVELYSTVESFVRISDGCDLRRRALESRVRDALGVFPRLLREGLADFVAENFGDHATDDFGILPTSLPGCVDDLDCQDSPFFGGERHGCDTCTNLCSRFHLEARRMHVRPEGLEVVLATNGDDPQAALLARPGSPTFLLCDERRDSNETADAVDALIGPQELGDFLARAVEGAVCDHDEDDCTDICGEFGLRCPFAALFVGGSGLPLSSTCNHGCCAPHVLCTTSGSRGRSACADLTKNRNHCGACGNICLEMEQCIDGSCMPLCL